MKIRSRTRRPRPIRPEPPLPAELTLRALGASEPRARRPRARRVGRILIILAAVLAAGLLVSAGAWATWPRLELTSAPTLTNHARPQLTLRVERALGLRAGDVHVTVDDARVGAQHVRVHGAKVLVTLPTLSDGAHAVRVSVERAGIARRTLTQTQRIVVDTTAPKLRLHRPQQAPQSAYVADGTLVITERPATIELDAEPGTRLSVRTTASGAASATARAGTGTTKLPVALPEGLHELVAEARDTAGNVRRVRQRVLVDTTGPRLAAPIPRIVKSATLDLSITARDAHGAALRVLVDGTELDSSLSRRVITPAPHAEASDDAAQASDTLPIGATWRVSMSEPVMEGRHTIELIATDSLGSVTKLRRMFIVDSAESLADVVGLKVGARGADVAELHTALISRNASLRSALGKELTMRAYGPATQTAVRSYQNERGIGSDGVAGSDTIAALTLKIVVNLSTKQLTLYRSGKIAKTYGVAVGSAEYPTPTGDFQIQNKQKDPTWTPPDSDWAKDAKPIPPGPDNPLGTRWMAIHGAVGIHGTNNAASIGYSVSHGCIRMRIPDVEELFEIVRVGTPVSVV